MNPFLNCLLLVSYGITFSDHSFLAKVICTTVIRVGTLNLSGSYQVTDMWLSGKLFRDGQFDFDLEDIMVMEAIWLSMQEPGIQRNTSPDDISEKDRNEEPSTPSSSSPSGGLACAIAVLAERQQMVGVSSSNQNVNLASQNLVPDNGNNSHYNAIEQDSNHYLQGAGISYTRSDMTDDSGGETSREVTWQ
ncbi:hypothetical protein AXX17_AT1G17940 [Arabidopsis thaliana]|jgi:hypothetical protein|uniref:Uncharacterized protein n=1 Tax=Arabidopsis thaliana TaxID=3702 RepID=A0A178WNW1_ARATH|nr:hypothetical protein AXX17_AT1G17940 [Arabidopsis thaliana]